MNSVLDLQQKGVGLTHSGDFKQAEEKLTQALTEATDPVTKANILRDLGDLVRRHPHRITEALRYLNESITILSGFVNTNLLEFTYTLHFMGRVERQMGMYDSSLAKIAQARGQIIRYLEVHPEAKASEHAQVLYLTLDYSAILALNGKVFRAVYFALKSIALTPKYGSSAHLKRAIVLLFFAPLPKSPISFVERAFFGRIAK